jgi:(1->4)-alpha-D-glucan 1-alpha-D-glucosylmutase
MPSAVPLATYRLQLTGAFGFDDAAALVPYLKALGITHLYASPFLKARAGSQHGYDIVDHSVLNPEYGGDEAFARLSDALAEADLGLILDFVPNHMAVGGADNAWWLDVLEWGPKSSYAPYFDIDWELLEHRRSGGILLPILGKSYGDALEAGEIAVKYDAGEGSFSAWYYEHRLPIYPPRYTEILRTVLSAAESGETPPPQQLRDLIARNRSPNAPSRAAAAAFKAELAAISGAAALIERGLAAYRPIPGDPASAAALHRLLERQWYRLAHWRLAVAEVNYRRFFDINSLAGLRVEDPRVFAAVHRRVRQLIAEKRLHGVRLDHIDGLRDPVQYCRQLQRAIREAQGEAARTPVYVVIEKILAEDEATPKFPGVSGTTGYSWLNVITRLLLDERGEPALTRTWEHIRGNRDSFAQVLERAKHRVIENMLASEFTVLVRLLSRIAHGHYRTRDYSIDRLRAAFEAFIRHFPVYRTYVTGTGATARDRAVIAGAIAAARAEWYGSDADIFDFLEKVLTLDLIAPGQPAYSRPRVRRFAFKVQQFTGPMMAKSLEDTAFYRYFKLLALNEVGGNPAASGLSIRQFHERAGKRIGISPHGMTATSTHDTKRGEDARARILALAEMAEEWSLAVDEWRAGNDALARRTDRVRIPSDAHEYLLYQTLIGAWPLEGVDETFVERIVAFAIKAAREGKVETSWIAPNEVYETGLTAFARRLLDRRSSAPFLDSFGAFARRAALLGALNSLSQLTLKTMMPGVPDFYQGTEFWDLSLVDPDNRRPVDFTARRTALETMARGVDWKDLAAHWQDGRIKLALTEKLLSARNAHPALFASGGYVPIEVTGVHRDHVIAFARTHGDDAVVVISTRHLAGFTDRGRHWFSAHGLKASLMLDGMIARGNALAPGRVPPQGEISVGSLLDPLPVAILYASVRQRRSGKPGASPHKALAE